jgi:hypothetical protein
MKHYFATDGNYGDAKDILIANTSKWTEKDFNKISEATDSDRIKIARKIDLKHTPKKAMELINSFVKKYGRN